MQQPGYWVTIGIGAFAVAVLSGCSGLGVVAGSLDQRAGDPPATTVSSLQFRRSVAPFPVRTIGGGALVQPFLGGFNVPRPQFVDIDGDGDDDLFVQEVPGQLMYFERSDSPAGPLFTWKSDWFQGLDIGEWYRFADADSDGDIDLFAEQRFSHIRVFRNIGSITEPRFELAVDTLRAADGRAIFSDRQNIPNIVDLDCDGRLDLFLGRVTGTMMR